MASAQLYDPSSGTFSVITGSLNTGSTDHTAVLLPDEGMLVVEGYDGNAGNIGYVSSDGALALNLSMGCEGWNRSFLKSDEVG